MPIRTNPARFVFAFLPLAIALSFGCSTRPVNVHHYDEEGRILPKKRYAKHLAVDLINRFNRTAYRRVVDSDFMGILTKQEQAVLEDLGAPQLMRRPFKSRGNELVAEWVYMGQQRVVQFIEGQVVYDGPLTDYERTLMKEGYPKTVTELSHIDGGMFIHWVYKEPFSTSSREYTFSKDKMISYVENR